MINHMDAPVTVSVVVVAIEVTDRITTVLRVDPEVDIDEAV